MEFCYINNSKSLFKKYARLVTWFGNTRLGREYLRHDNFYIPDGKLELLLPNGYIQGKGKKHTLTVTTRPVYAPRLYPALQLIDSVDVTFRQSLELFYWMAGFQGQPVWATNRLALNLTVYPDSHPETTSVDGTVIRDVAEESFASIRGGNGTLADDTAARGNHRLTAGNAPANTWVKMQRSFTLFDTSALTSSATISDATLSYFITDKADTQSQSLGIVQCTVASNTSLAASDYQGTVNNSTRQATDKTIASLTLSAYADYSLNATGLSNISKTGVTKFGGRLSSDADNSAPTWGANLDSYAQISFADEGANKPKLSINYTLPSAGGNKSFMGLMGIGN